MKTEQIILEKDVVLPPKETIEVYNLGTVKVPQYVVTEKTAIYKLTTHIECECGNIYAKNSYCRSCSSKREREQYFKKPFKEWDGEAPLCIHNDDTYFWDEESIQEYIEENELELEDLRLVICEPNHLHEIDVEYFCEQEYWPENLDSVGDFDKELDEKLKELNAYIRTLKPISWSEGKYRTVYKYEPEWKKETN